MPELPEVQTIVDDLNKKVVGRRITGVWFDWPKMLKDPLDQQRNFVAHKHVAVFEKTIKGKKILGVKRRAKNILISLSDGWMMLIHLKMTGHLLLGKWKIIKRKEDRGKRKDFVVPIEPEEAVKDPYNQYIHLIFYLDPVRSRPPRGGRSHSLKARAASNGVDNGKMLAFSDLRKFGKAVLGTKEQIENLPEIKNLGPEPLDPNFTFNQFKERILYSHGRVRIAEPRIAERRRAFRMQKIKQVLMDPGVIAGIGNIYSDDILWSAKIHPFKKSNELNVRELNGLWIAMRKILTKALKLRGTSISDYRDTAGKEGNYADYRLVYQREGEPCRRCKTKIKRVKIGGRSAHFCPKCQRL